MATNTARWEFSCDFIAAIRTDGVYSAYLTRRAEVDAARTARKCTPAELAAACAMFA